MTIDTHAHFWRPLAEAVPSQLGQQPPVGHDEVLAQMDAAGVDKLVEITPGPMGFDNSYSFEVAAQFPDRLRIMGRFDTQLADLPERLRQLFDQPYIVGLRYMFLLPPDVALLDAGELEPLWTAAEELDIAIAVYAPDRSPQVGEIAQRHPGLRLLIDHAAVQLMPVNGRREPFARWAELLALQPLANVYVKISGLPEATDEQYPFPKAQQRLRELTEHFGADRLLWGSGYPTVKRVCTYQEALDWVRVESAFLTAEDRDKILHKAAARALKLPW
jgi:predicted TIM-barrel fold metal-dependent hydrolase